MTFTIIRIQLIRKSIALITFVNQESLSFFETLSGHIFLLLTARPWAERGSSFTSGFVFVVLSVTRPKPLSASLRMTQLMMFIRLKLLNR